ncbi:MAG: cellulase family glycosylhydrolase, partial [Chlorobia bacterium]|nr:cellulase family glycosylhydrolase [Fimbriimonadaceae bacterium]
MVATLLSSLLLTTYAGPLPLRVIGTEVIDSKNQPVWLRGVNCAAMEWDSTGEGHVLETVQVAVEDWRVNHVRIPLSQDRWFGKAPEQTDSGKSYQALLKRIVDYCNGKGVYVMIDLHWNSGAQWGKNIGQHKLTDEHSILFWNDVAKKYKNHPAVIFDLYNEPHDITWDVWRDGGQITETNRQTNTTLTFKGIGMKELLKTVRDTGAKNVVVVGGLDWSYDMSGFLNGHKLEDPKGNGIIYANHAYPFKGDTFEKWTTKMDLAIKTLPIVVSEFGSDPRGGTSGLSGADWVKKVVNY